MPDTAIYEALLEMKAQGEAGVLVTVVEKQGHAPAELGGKMLVSLAGRKCGTIGGGTLEFTVIKEAIKAIQEESGKLKKYSLNPDNQLVEGEATGMLCGGSITLFYEYLAVSPRLYLFGAGHIGEALVYHLQKLDFHITLVDNRQGFVEKIPGAQKYLTEDYELSLQNEPVAPDSYFIIASHSHALDYVILKHIYTANWRPKYIGLVASTKKAASMKAQLQAELQFQPDWHHLYSPAGLNTGGQSPNAIAISIIAEMQALRFAKEGHHHMRNINHSLDKNGKKGTD